MIEVLIPYEQWIWVPHPYCDGDSIPALDVDADTMKSIRLLSYSTDLRVTNPNEHWAYWEYKYYFVFKSEAEAIQFRLLIS